MTKKVVFTGPAKFNGEPVVRADLTAAAVKAGYVVRGKVDGLTDLLVASRDDTQKAQAAAAMGITVIDYQLFGVILQQAGCPILKSGEAPNPYVDVDLDDHVPDFTMIDYGSLL